MVKYELVAFTAFLAGVVADRIDVTIYTKGDCTEPSTTIEPMSNTDQVNACYNYVWNGSNSAKITHCQSGASCACTYYAEENCGGQSVRLGENKCASHGGGWRSYKCSAF